LRVYGLSRQFVGQSSYTTLETANRLLLERHLVTGAMLQIDPGRSQAVEGKLNDMTEVATVLSQEKALENFSKNLGTMLYTVTIMVLFAVILGFAIVYNSTLISLAERHRELALLRVMGMTEKEVSILLLNESLVQAVLGILFGLPLGYWMANGFARAVSTDLFSIQAVIYPMTYLYAAIGGCVFITIAHLFAQRGVKHLELVEVLKERD
jgi:putative ABC transport system permease protein